MTDHPQAIARRMHSAWAQAFAARQWTHLAELYTEQPALYGSTPELQTSRDGVRTYFQTLPPNLSAARYAEPEVTPLGPHCFAASGQVIFVNRRGDGHAEELEFRMTQVLVQEDGVWRIAVHHASARPGPLLSP